MFDVVKLEARWSALWGEITPLIPPTEFHMVGRLLVHEAQHRAQGIIIEFVRGLKDDELSYLIDRNEFLTEPQRQDAGLAPQYVQGGGAGTVAASGIGTRPRE